MDTALQNGDFAVTAGGLPYAITGLEECLQRAQLRLQMRLGGLVYAPELGSLLYTLTDRSQHALAVRYAAQALAEEADLSVTALDWQEDGLSYTIATPYGTGTVVVPMKTKEGKYGSENL